MIKYTKEEIDQVLEIAKNNPKGFLDAARWAEKRNNAKNLGHFTEKSLEAWGISEESDKLNGKRPSNRPPRQR